MSKGLRFSLLVLGLSIVAPLACGVTESSSGSNTNWISICTDDDDCSNGYSCLCGVCTSGCELEADDCQAAGAQCTELAAVGCKSRDDYENACLPTCAEDEDCDSFGDNLACEAGVCIADTGLDEPPVPIEDLKLPDLEPLSGPASLALGGDSPCVTRDGRVWCWGSNRAGQAAQPPGDQNVPIAELEELEELEGVAELVAGGQHKCALTEDGRVYCWGLNDRGQVGPESAPSMTCSELVPDHGPQDIPCQPTPTLVPDLPTVVGLTLNETTTCAWFEDGDFTCWGETSYLESAEEALSEGVSWLALGHDILCAVSSAQELWCSDDDAPAFDSLSEIALSPEFDGGPTFGCALDADGAVNCWGRDDSGQRGLSSFGAPEPAADDQPAIREDALEVHVGQNHACALLVDGSVACWGRNDFGETGAPPNVTPRCDGMACQPSPTPVLGLPPAVDLASRGGMTCALSEDAELYCWGSSDFGSPWRLPGPWEGGANVCDGIDQAIANEILTARRAGYAYTQCETERDCVDVDLGVSCHQGCQSAPMHENDADAMRAELARIDDTYCLAAEQQDCAFPGPECPPRKGELACVEGACVRVDADATDCENACACKVLQEIAYDPPGTEQECYALKLQRFVSCTTCAGSGLYFAISNTGQEAFAGEVAIELWSEPEVALREPVTFELSLEPGEHSEPLYIESDGASGLGVARLIAPDSCDFMSEWTDIPFDMPAPATCSE